MNSDSDGNYTAPDALDTIHPRGPDTLQANSPDIPILSQTAGSSFHPNDDPTAPRPPLPSRLRRENRYPASSVDEADSRKASFAQAIRESLRNGVNLSPGDTLGRYRIVSVLGRGGMGVVYKAEHILAPQLLFAVKALQPHALGESTELAIREATTMAALRHRNIVRVMDVGTSADNTAFLAMEYIGPDLGEYLRARGGTLAPKIAVEFCAQVCDALEVAHRQRIVHRDIKPGNCLVHSENGDDYIVVCDFGLARVLHSEGAPSSEWTLVGSRGYMAPELLSGQFRPDHRVDIYSVGIMLFCLLTGSPPIHPFAPDDETRAHLKRVPPNLIKILRKAVANSPEQRYSAAKTLGTALRHASAFGLSVPSSLPSSDPAMSRRLMFSLGALCLVAASIPVFITAAYWNAPLDSPPIAMTEGPTEAISSRTRPAPRVDVAPTVHALGSAPVTQEPATPAAAQVEPRPQTAREPLGPSKPSTPKTRSTQRLTPTKGHTQILLEASGQGPLPIGENKTSINALCARISKECVSKSAEKRKEKYKNGGLLTAMLTLRRINSTVGAEFTNWGILADDSSFQGCARSILHVHPLIIDVGSENCFVTM